METGRPSFRLISIVVPIRDEGASVAKLAAEIEFICRGFNLPYELVFVDDGSRDDSWMRICNESAGRAAVRGVRLARNFGKAAALTAGFRVARGDVVFTMDGDLQDNPEDIPRFLAKLGEGFDLVSGWKRRRADPWHKVASSRLFNVAVSTLTGVSLHDHNCGFKCFRRDVARGVRVYGHLHRFIPVLAAAQGWRVGELEVNHRARRFGMSKYGWSRAYRGSFDLLTIIGLTAFRQSPMHLFGAFGLAGILTGGGGLTYLATLWLRGQGIGNRPLMIYAAAALILGVQMFALGIIAELITAYMIKPREIYSISAKTVTAADAGAYAPGTELALAPGHHTGGPSA